METKAAEPVYFTDKGFPEIEGTSATSKALCGWQGDAGVSPAGCPRGARSHNCGAGTGCKAVYRAFFVDDQLSGERWRYCFEGSGGDGDAKGGPVQLAGVRRDTDDARERYLRRRWPGGFCVRGGAPVGE